jgi:large subunit ribosomal protein L23
VRNSGNPRDILVKPVISEKSYRLADDGKYTFIVAPGSNKTEIRQAVEAVFRVKVTGVNTINRASDAGRALAMASGQTPSAPS